MTSYMKNRLLQLRLTMVAITAALMTTLFWPLVVLAADAAASQPVTAAPSTQKWWQALLIPIVSTVGVAVAAFLVAGLRKLTKLIEAKWQIDIPDSVEKLMAEKARWFIAWAEEKAENRLLHGDGVKTDGAKKLADVVSLMEDFAKKMGYGEDWRRDKIEQLVEGVLHLERDQGVGSTGTPRGDALIAKTNGNGK